MIFLFKMGRNKVVIESFEKCAKIKKYTEGIMPHVKYKKKSPRQVGSMNVKKSTSCNTRTIECEMHNKFVFEVPNFEVHFADNMILCPIFIYLLFSND